MNLNIKLNTSKSQVNRYLENVLYQVVEGILYLNAGKLVFDSGHGWKQFQSLNKSFEIFPRKEERGITISETLDFNIFW
jgi:hypothetical protein